MPATDTADGFSLVTGGPLYEVCLRTHLFGPAIQPLRRLIGITVLICWLPLLVLTLAHGSFLSGSQIPFLYDLDVHTRLLFALPLLLASENIVHRLLRPLVREFVDRGIVRPEDRDRFAGLAASAMRLRNSLAIELVLLAGVIGFGLWVWERNLIPGEPTWYAGATGHLTAAGYWYGFVSLSILRFLLLRWYFRIALWYGFLWGVRSLPLRLNLFHPDRAGGLGFLVSSVAAFTPILMAESIMVAGTIGNRIWHAGQRLPDFKIEILGFTLVLMITALAPLFFFVAPMSAARHTALHQFGRLASRYVEDFREKWMPNDRYETETPLGSTDLQSLADLGSAYESASNMGLVPFRQRTVGQLAILLLLPFAPLTLTLAPLEQMIDGLIKLVI